MISKMGLIFLDNAPLGKLTKKPATLASKKLAEMFRQYPINSSLRKRFLNNL